MLLHVLTNVSPARKQRCSPGAEESNGWCSRWAVPFRSSDGDRQHVHTSEGRFEEESELKYEKWKMRCGCLQAFTSLEEGTPSTIPPSTPPTFRLVTLGQLDHVPLFRWVGLPFCVPWSFASEAIITVARLVAETLQSTGLLFVWLWLCIAGDGLHMTGELDLDLVRF